MSAAQLRRGAEEELKMVHTPRCSNEVGSMVVVGRCGGCRAAEAASAAEERSVAGRGVCNCVQKTSKYAASDRIKLKMIIKNSALSMP